MSSECVARILQDYFEGLGQTRLDVGNPFQAAEHDHDVAPERNLDPGKLDEGRRVFLSRAEHADRRPEIDLDWLVSFQLWPVDGLHAVQEPFKLLVAILRGEIPGKDTNLRNKTKG